MSFPRYERYKDSGVEWLGEVPEHWIVKRLRFVAELNPSKSHIAGVDKDTLVSFLPMTAIGDDGILNLEREMPISEVENGYTFFQEGDVVVAKITPCFENGKGAVMRGLSNGVGFGTTELIVARPKAGEMGSHYLHWLFISTLFRKLGEAHMYGAGGQKRVPDDFVRDFLVALPNLAEQCAIAAFLDRETGTIDALIAEQRRLIDLLKEKRQAVISHAVTKGLNPDAPMKDSGVAWLGNVPEHWEIGRVRHVAYHGLINGLFKKKDEFGSGAKFINVFDIYREDHVIDSATLDRVQVTPQEASSFEVQLGDIFFVRSSLKMEGIAASAWIRQITEPTVFDCHLSGSVVKGRRIC